MGGNSGSSSLRSPEALRASAHSGDDPGREVELLRAALAPFAAMGRVIERRSIVTFGKMSADSEILCESSGEAGIGILTMGHFRDAAALIPDAPGWGGAYINPRIREGANQ